MLPAHSTCPSCGYDVLTDERFCGQCGANLSAATVEPPAGTRTRLTVDGPPNHPCPICTRGVLDGELFCPNCGTSTTGAAPGGSAGTAIRGCTKCGTVMGPGELFCRNCGTLRSSTPSGSERLANAAEEAWIGYLNELAGSTQGEYDLLGELGRGGMAGVFLAHERALGRKVAIKIMSPVLALYPDAISRFDDEAKTMAALKHPNIVGIHAVRSTPVHYFVMEYVEGKSLDVIIARCQPLPLPAIQDLVYQIGSALSHAHKQGVVHRDIKGSNILIDRTGAAIVSDFGIAKVLVGTTNRETASPIGTSLFMSPEQLLMKPVSGASDQYSLGILVYELVTGRLPFTGTRVQVEQAHLNQIPPRADKARPDCPAWLAGAIGRMLAKEPEARFPSVLEAVKALGGFVAEEGTATRNFWIQAVAGRQPDPLSIGIRLPGSDSIQRGVTTGRPVSAGRLGMVGGALGVVAIGVWIALRPHTPPRPPLLPPPVFVPESTPPGNPGQGPRGDGTGKGTVASGENGGVSRLGSLVAGRIGPLTVGDTAHLSAAATRADGGRAAARVTWRVIRGSSIRLLDANGLVQAQDSGDTSVRAEAANFEPSRELVVRVAAPRLAALTIDGLPDSGVVGQRIQLRITGRDASGRPLIPAGVVWTATPGDRAAIEGDNLVLRATGDVSVSAGAGPIVARQTLRVAAPVVVGDPAEKTKATDAPDSPEAATKQIELLLADFEQTIGARRLNRLPDYRAEVGTKEEWQDGFLALLRADRLVSAKIIRQRVSLETADNASATIDLELRVKDAIINATNRVQIPLRLRFGRAPTWYPKSYALLKAPPE